MSNRIEEVLRRGPATSKDIQRATGMNQATVSRRIRAMGDRLLQVKIGRSPHYMLSCGAFGGGDRLLLFMVDPHGNNTSLGCLRPLAHGGFFLEKLPGMPSVLLGEGKNGLFKDLPYFLYDLAPQGYIGRQIAANMAEQAGFPDDPKQWNLEHIGQYLISNGDDLPGNLKLGAQAHLRLRRKPVAYTVEDYPRLAEAAVDGTIPGSSAGGEQPKFTAYGADRSAHVIVKFSPKGDEATAVRWRDILITEFHAAQALHAKNYPAAETRLIESDGRLFLESQRFDRTGEFGRLSMISLQCVDAEFVGIGHGWHKVMKALYDLGLVSWQHFFDTVVLWYFGKLINNTDMHLGNLSLGIEGDVFRILPVYDMCSMGFVPNGGEVRPFRFECPDLVDLTLFLPTHADAIRGIVDDMARDFWNRVAGDKRISQGFRDFLAPCSYARHLP
jgi:HipA-like C-terminal domain